MHLINDIMKVGTKISADLRKLNSNISRACTVAARRVFKGFKSDLQAQAGAALGPKIEKTWQGETFPKNGTSKDASVFIFSKAPKIALAFDKGVTIKSSGGWWLAIPSENCPKTYLGKPVTPSNWPKDYYGRLDMIYNKRGRHAFLVAQHPPGTRERKKVDMRGGERFSAKNLKSGISFQQSVMFFLVPQVTLAKKLDVASLSRIWLKNFSEMITQELSNE